MRKGRDQRITVEMLRKGLVDEVGSPSEIYRWFLRKYRWLKRLGFKNTSHGILMKGPFRVVFRWNRFPDGSVMGMSRVFGPDTPIKPKKLTDYSGLKMVVLNKHGQIRKIPIENWDPNRKSRRVSQQ